MKFRFSKAISLVLSFAMLVSMFAALPVASAEETEDIFAKFADKGIYAVASSAGDTESGLRVLSGKIDTAYDYALYLLDDTEGWSAAGITEETVAAAKTNNCKYVSQAKDGAWNYSTAADKTGLTKDVWYTTRNYRNTGSYRVIGGNIYFGLNNAIITPTDKNLTFFIEYFDEGTADMVLRYCTGGKTNNPIVISRTNSMEWKTAVISVTDAALSSTNSGTGLGTGSEDFRIEANNIDTYISRVMVLKTSDYLGQDDTEEEDKEIIKPEEDMTKQIFLVGDSICEVLSPTLFPREGWGMEIADFFTGEVRFVNKAKGGKSTRTFLSGHDPTAGDDVYDTRMQDILAAAHEGDYLFINLGINDAINGRDTVKTDATILTDGGDGTSFRANLAKFKQIADENGLIPIFITSTRIRSFNADGTMKDDGVQAHRDAMIEVGQQLGVTVLDLGSAHKALVESLGVNDSALIYMHTTAEAYPNLPSWCPYTDNTHINQTGAREICKLIVNLIKQGADAGNATLAGLYNYVDKTEDLTPFAKPVRQSHTPDYDVKSLVYTVNGEESNDYYAGTVSAKATVKNGGSAQEKASLYLVVYNSKNEIADISVSPAVEIAAGATGELVADCVELPDLDGYKFRKYIWSDNLRPYTEEIAKLNFTADGYNRHAELNWTEKQNLGEAVSYEIYRDGILIATTTGGAYIDEDVTRGAHSYCINVVDSKGNVLYQTPSAVVTVKSMDDLDGTILYTKARLNSNGAEEDINKGILCYRTNKLYPSEYAQYYFNNVTDDMYAEIMASKVAYAHDGSDGPIVVKRVTDDYGITKDAWFTTQSYCFTDTRPGRQIKNSCMYFNVENQSITPEDSVLTVFVDYLGNRNGLQLEYMNFTMDGETLVQGSTSKLANDIATNSWKTARFELTDAYFDQTKTNFFNGKTDFRITSGGTDLYVSSVTIVKDSGTEALAKYASINPSFTNNVVKTGSALYPDGVSIDFSSGTAVMNGMRNFRREDNNNADASAAIIQDEDGQYCFSTQRAMTGEKVKQTYAYFAIDDAYMFGNNDNTAIVEMVCKAEYDTPINWLSHTYNKSAGTSTFNVGKAVANINANAEDPWQTITFKVDGIAFNNLDNGGCDFRLSIPADLADENKQLKIRKITVKNANAIERSVAAADNIVRVFVAGDSIAAPYATGSTTIGWGMRLPDFISTQIVNKALPGSSTKTFPNLNSILYSAKEGDYVLMQFGHNDSMTYDPRGVEVDQYKVNLKDYVKRVRKEHAVPVILTSIPRYDVANGVLYYGEGDGIQAYRDAAIEVANEMGVAYIDVAAKMDEKAADYTSEQLEPMFVDEGSNLRVHLTESGATFVAELIAEELKNNEKINVLKGYIK